MKILALSGGNARGIIALEILKYLERRAGRPLWEEYDQVIGISAGSTLATGLGLHLPLDFLEKSFEILAAHVKKMNSLKAIFRPGLPHDQLINDMLGILPNQPFGDLKMHTLIYCYDYEKKQLVCYDNQKPEDKIIDLKTILARSTFIPSMAYSKERKDLIVDAGMATAHPAILYLTDYFSELKDKEFEMTVVCCGKKQVDLIQAIQQRKKGLISWIGTGALTNEMVYVDAAYQDYLLNQLFMKHIYPKAKIEIFNPWVDYSNEFNLDFSNIKTQVKEWLINHQIKDP